MSPRAVWKETPSTPEKMDKAPVMKVGLDSARRSLPGLFAVGWWPTRVSWVENPPLPWLPAWLLATVMASALLESFWHH